MMDGRPHIAVLLSPALRERIVSAAAWKQLTDTAVVHAPDIHSNDPSAWSAPTLLGESVEACITGWDTPPITADDLRRAPRLRVIAHTGGSVRNLVPPEVYDRAIRVTHAAPVLADGVAEYTVMAILVGLRRLPEFHQGLTTGQPWQVLAALPPGTLLRDQTVGIIGASRVGRAVLNRLAGFGCPILLHDPSVTEHEAAALGALRVDLSELLTRCDVVSLHAPLLPETAGMIGAAELQRLHDGALLVNTARAGLVDEAALIAELRAGRLHAALDVFWEEPLPLDSVWRELPHLVVTPHNAALTKETLFEQGQAMIDEVHRALSGQALEYEIDRRRYAVIA
jgi:phosphoglycerate dehydrogenase-like enzyme